MTRATSPLEKRKNLTARKTRATVPARNVEKEKRYTRSVQVLPAVTNLVPSRSRHPQLPAAFAWNNFFFLYSCFARARARSSSSFPPLFPGVYLPPSLPSFYNDSSRLIRHYRRADLSRARQIPIIKLHGLPYICPEFSPESAIVLARNRAVRARRQPRGRSGQARRSSEAGPTGGNGASRE